MKYYIIGGGITGLTIAHCLHHSGIQKSDIVIFTKDVGGQVKNGVYLGPRIIRRNTVTAKFVKSIGYEGPTKLFNVGYLHEDGSISNECDVNERHTYLKKAKREYDDSVMSNGIRTFAGWNWEDIGILDFLSREYAQCINIVSNDVSSDFIVGLSETKDVKVIVTINIFHKNKTFDSQFVSFYEYCGTDFDEVIDYDYVYDVRKDSKLKRINLGKKIICEVDGDEPFSEENYKYLTTLPQVYYNEHFEKYGEVILEGRFARLEHSCKLEDVIGRWFK